MNCTLVAKLVRPSTGTMLTVNLAEMKGYGVLGTIPLDFQGWIWIRDVFFPGFEVLELVKN